MLTKLQNIKYLINNIFIFLQKIKMYIFTNTFILLLLGKIMILNFFV